MPVSHIAYVASKQRYFVYFTEKSPPETDIIAVYTALLNLSPLVSRPVAGVSVHGRVVHFTINRGVGTQDALRAVVRRIEPSCAATALKLSLGCTSFGCGVHGVVEVTTEYAPGLEVADEHVFTTRLVAQLETIGLPGILPRSPGTMPIMVLAGVRQLCFGLGVFMQGLELAWLPNLAPCSRCLQS